MQNALYLRKLESPYREHDVILLVSVGCHFSDGQLQAPCQECHLVGVNCSVLNCIVKDNDSSAILIKTRIVYFT